VTFPSFLSQLMCHWACTLWGTEAVLRCSPQSRRNGGRAPCKVAHQFPPPPGAYRARIPRGTCAVTARSRLKASVLTPPRGSRQPLRLKWRTHRTSPHSQVFFILFYFGQRLKCARPGFSWARAIHAARSRLRPGNPAVHETRQHRTQERRAQPISSARALPP